MMYTKESRPLIADVDEAIEDMKQQGYKFENEFTDAMKQNIFNKALSFIDIVNTPRLEAIENAIRKLYGDRILDESQYRICSHCGKTITEGYIRYEDYLCEDCRKKLFTDEEWAKEYEEAGGDGENDDVYWTVWKDA